ncbi:class I SAM-dependent methyltransferase [Streptomyces sp. NPDC021224]|uniref:class I SAM-dependent methyltransferase n=1 Tax=unclassified Streptomyces TaxID=2593676 RepID=UPI0037AD27C8
MAPTLYRGSRPAKAHTDRARDWAEIQERMLVPLYDAVHERLGVGPGTRLLALNCGSGLALLLAAARGASVTGYDTDPARLRLARERLGTRRADAPGAEARQTPGAAHTAEPTHTAGPAHTARPSHDAGPFRLHPGAPDAAGLRGGGYGVVTALDPAVPAAALRPALAAVAATARRGGAVVLAGWGPPERCAAAAVLRVATRLAERGGGSGTGPEPRLSGRDDLEELAAEAGLRPDGSGRVSCPFGYPDRTAAVRGLLSTGLFDAAVAATDPQQVEKELAEALHPYRRPDGSVRMDNVFRYLVART